MMRRKKAFFCVETAIVLSLYLMILCLFIELGVDFYRKADRQAQNSRQLIEIETLCRLGRVSAFGTEDKGEE